jgi:hypothetical protein
MFLTFVTNEHPPRRTNAIQSEQGASTMLQPVASLLGSTMKPNLPFSDILGPNTAALSANVSLDTYMCCISSVSNSTFNIFVFILP